MLDNCYYFSLLSSILSQPNQPIVVFLSAGVQSRNFRCTKYPVMIAKDPHGIILQIFILKTTREKRMKELSEDEKEATKNSASLVA